MAKRNGEITPAKGETRELVEAYRELCLDIKKKTEAFGESIKGDKLFKEELEKELAAKFRAEGIKGVTIDSDDPDMRGTCSINTQVRYKVADAEKWFGWVIENDATDMLTTHISPDAISEFVTENKILPPGLSSESFQKVGFRKAGK